MRKEKVYLVLFLSLLLTISIIIIQFTFWKKSYTDLNSNQKYEINEINKNWFHLKTKRPLTKESLSSLKENEIINLENIKNISIEAFVSKFFPNLKKFFYVDPKLLKKYLKTNKKIIITAKPTAFEIIKRKEITESFLKELNINEENFVKFEINLLIILIKNEKINKETLKFKIFEIFINKKINFENIWKKITDHIIL